MSGIGVQRFAAKNHPCPPRKEKFGQWKKIWVCQGFKRGGAGVRAQAGEQRKKKQKLCGAMFPPFSPPFFSVPVYGKCPPRGRWPPARTRFRQIKTPPLGKPQTCERGRPKFQPTFYDTAPTPPGSKTTQLPWPAPFRFWVRPGSPPPFPACSAAPAAKWLASRGFMRKPGPPTDVRIIVKNKIPYCGAKNPPLTLGAVASVGKKIGGPGGLCGAGGQTLMSPPPGSVWFPAGPPGPGRT